MSIAPPVTFHGDEMAVRFTDYGPESYRLFLRLKALPEQRTEFDPDSEQYTVTAPARFAPLLGVGRPAPAVPDLPLSDWLYDDQRYVVGQALEAKRFAVWSDCGLGKTNVGLEFARHVTHRTGGGRVLVVTFGEIVPQWVEEAARFYGDALPVRRLATREEVRDWCAGRVPGPERVAATNYEKFNHKDAADQVVSELRHLAGLILDESSRLKTGGGKQKWALIKSGKGVEYKLSLTATPAPNNAMEFASQASFLERMRTEAEVIWTYFRKNPDTGEWDLRPHARAAFFRWMSSWSIYIRDPKRFGWRLTLPEVPEPEYLRVPIDPTPEQLAAARAVMADGEEASLFAVRTPNAIERVKLSEVAKGFVYQRTAKGRKVNRIPSHKPAVVARIVKDEFHRGAQVLVWTVFDGESTLLAEQLARAGVPFDLLTGDTPDADRVEILTRFRKGDGRVLVSRASLLGFGMNFQFIDAMVFSGWSDSWEAFYQAVRRGQRWGRVGRLRIYLPFVRELEEETLANLDAKGVRVAAEIEDMELEYVRILGRAG